MPLRGCESIQNVDKIAYMHLTPTPLPETRKLVGIGQMHDLVTPSPLRGTSKMGEGAGGEVEAAWNRVTFTTPLWLG